MPTRTGDLPRTIQRSPAKARRTYAKTHDNAVREYGEGERAHRTAIAALKHSYEKVGDHWEPKDRPGPSDERAVRNERGLRDSGSTAGGVEGHTKQELYERARRLGVRGRSRMDKQELGAAIARAEG